MDKNLTVKSIPIPLQEPFERDYFYLRKLQLKSVSLNQGCQILVYQFSSKGEIIWYRKNSIKFQGESLQFHYNNRFRSFDSSLYLCKDTNKGLILFYFLMLTEKLFFCISSAFYILAHELRLLPGHTARPLGNFDNLPNLNILFILFLLY